MKRSSCIRKQTDQRPRGGVAVRGIVRGIAGSRKKKTMEAKKSGLKAVTLIAALNPVSQVLW
jgi:hypothetical protein